MLHNVSNRYFLLSVLFIIVSGRVFSQVNIKERVEIKPKPLVQVTTTHEVVLFADDPNPSGPVHVLVLHPCTVTASATIEMQGTPSSNLFVKTLVGGSMAWYNGHYKDPPEQGSNPITFQIACGSIPIKMESTWEGIDVRSTTKTIGSNSASFVFQGMLSGCSYTVRAQLQATIDASYDIASMELTADTNQITQCWGSTTLHSKIRNNKGEEYTGVPCQNPPVPVAISVESTSDVLLSTPWQQGRSITLPYGDLAVNFTWNYRGETKNSEAIVTLAVGTQTKTTTINLMVDTTLVGLQFEDVAGNLLHMMKTKVTVRGLGCGGMGSAPLPDGTSLDLSIIEGMNYGFLVDPETGRQGTHLPSLKTKGGCATAEYWAQGDNPSVWEGVILRATSATASAQYRINILGAQLRVSPGRQVIGYGDTTSVVVERGNEDDGYSLIPKEWNTMYQMVEADTAGYFYTPDSSKTGSPLIGLYPEARYYAKNRTVNPDSLVLLLMVTSVEPRVGGDDKVKDGSGSAGRPVMLKTVETTRKATKASNGKVMSDMVEPPNLGNGWYHYGMAQLVVKKEEQLDHFKVTFEKDTIAFTETSKIFVQAKDANDANIEFDAGKLLKLTITSNEEYGTFIDKNADTLKTIPVMLDNIAYDDARTGLIRFAAVKDEPDSTIMCIIGVALENDTSKNGKHEVGIRSNIQELLLGESRYFYVENDNGRLSIDSTSNPSFVPQMNEDVWGSEPVLIANKDNAKGGKRLGVYWEKKKPDGTALASGMIRLIGRLWNRDSVYRASLIATRRSERAKTTVEVGRPRKLGTQGSIVLNVFNQNFSLDSVLVKYGGIYGIPPQMLKGQVGREGNYKPAYRWEPMLDAKYHRNDNNILRNRHIIKSQNDCGTPGIPSDHLNVYPVPYWGFQGTIWDLMYQHSFDLNGNVVQNSSEDMYSRYNTNGDLLWGSEEVAEEWITIINRVWNDAVSHDSSDMGALQMARDSANYWLRYRYLGGAMNNIAQTRVSSSYGFIQPLYGTVIAMGFPIKDDQHPPELINMVDTAFTYAIPYLVKMLTNEQKVQNSNTYNWILGWDKTFQIAFSCYNKPSLVGAPRLSWGYGIDVLDRSRKFPPQK